MRSRETACALIRAAKPQLRKAAHALNDLGVTRIPRLLAG